MIIYNQNQQYFYSTKINDGGIFSGFGTRFLGNGRQTETMLNFFEKNQTRYKKIVIPNQIHSTNLEVFQSGSSVKIESIEDTDGVITKENDVILTVRTADCLPIIFSSKDSGIIGISHQGWRGSLKKMVIKMVDKMVDLGAELETIAVAIGPGIGPCCYDIDEDRYYQFLEEFDGYSTRIFHFHGSKRFVDLTQLNYLLLVAEGIKKYNIDFFPFCTSCDQARFFSFRRSKENKLLEMFHFIMKTDKPKLFAELN